MRFYCRLSLGYLLLYYLFLYVRVLSRFTYNLKYKRIVQITDAKV